MDLEAGTNSIDEANVEAFQQRMGTPMTWDMENAPQSVDSFLGSYVPYEVYSSGAYPHPDSAVYGAEQTAPLKPSMSSVGQSVSLPQLSQESANTSFEQNMGAEAFQNVLIDAPRNFVRITPPPTPSSLDFDRTYATTCSFLPKECGRKEPLCTPPKPTPPP